MKIIYVPLDERPCNYRYPSFLADMCDDITLLVPPIEMMGLKKTPCSVEEVWKWVFENAADCQYAILSVDTLVYGNIINSRIHMKDMDKIRKYLGNFRKIKDINPSIEIHAFNLVTRVAAYNSSEEDPDYWEQYGRKIWEYCRLSHRIEEKINPVQDNSALEELIAGIPGQYMDDFLSRRKKNRFVNHHCVEMVKEGALDYLVIPKDDCAEYGFAAMDQKSIDRKVIECDVSTKVLVYPGADEVGSVLFARVFNASKGIVPRVLVRYSSVNGPLCVPKYEDRCLHESVKYQITSAGGVVVSSEPDSDLLLAVHSPWSSDMMESADQLLAPFAYKTGVNIPEFVRYIDYYCKNYGKTFSIADVAFCNGADDTLMRYASRWGLFDAICGYGGWNTSQNTIGVTLAHGMIISHYRMFENNERARLLSTKFLLRKIVEDWIHQYRIVLYAHSNAQEFESTDPYAIDDVDGRLVLQIASLMNGLFAESFGDTFHGKKLRIENVRLPWNRLFETDFDIVEVE